MTNTVHAWSCGIKQTTLLIVTSIWCRFLCLCCDFFCSWWKILKKHCAPCGMYCIYRNVSPPRPPPVCSLISDYYVLSNHLVCCPCIISAVYSGKCVAHYWYCDVLGLFWCVWNKKKITNNATTFNFQDPNPKPNKLCRPMHWPWRCWGMNWFMLMGLSSSVMYSCRPITITANLYCTKTHTIKMLLIKTPEQPCHIGSHTPSSER